MFSIFHESLLEQTEDDSDASSSTAVGHESTNDTYQSFNRENQPDIQSLSHSISTSTSEFHSKRVARSCSIFDDSESECDDDDSGRAPSNFSPLLENQNIDFSSIAPLLQNLNVVQCRELIDKISNHCTSNFLRVVKEASSAVPNGEAYAEKFKNRVSNLYNQHDEYEKFVSSIKTQLTESKTQNEFYNVGVVIEKFLKEFKLFQQFLPAYGFREKILEEIKKSQVTIISADYSYFLNVALPIILSNTYQNHTVIACEANEILSHVLQRKINYLLSNKNLPSHDSPLCVLSENQLLERFSYTTLFSGSNSCVILNSSVKRSVTGDIILSNLRDLLTTQTNSKLVLLLSPYDNTAKYVDYFLAKKLVVSKLNLPSILLPVKTVWKTGLSSPGENYQDDLVRTIISIHAVSEPGDIVTFLPSDEDVRSLSEELDIKIHNYQYSDLKIACIYDEDLYSFVKSEKGRALERKVFLFVNNYEGLIIPSVRYIIDSGIQKESMYDSKSGVDVVAPTFVSQTRAKVRKYLAGMHNAGICFRLYSKTNYLKNMRNKEYSELFTGNPLHSIVKIFQHCPQKVKSLPNDGEILFVESLPNDVLINNVKLLKSYGAIDNNSCLTPFGEKMVKLPLPTKYTKLILYGLQYGFAFEAVVLVAFFSVKSAVFVDSVDEAHQKSIDAVKLHFNQQNSDTLMWLNIFKQWKVHRFRQSFCTKYHINHATLTNVRRKVNEIIHLVQEFLDQEVIQQFSESNDFSLVIQMLFECFNENLCTYSGHHRVGYKVLGNQQFALIHPSSVLSLIGDLPVYVIYEDIVVSDQRYIRNLTSIPFDDVMKYREEGILSYNDDVLFDDKLVERAIDGVGEKIVSEVLLKNSGRKAREFEEIVKNKTGTEVVIIDPVLERGSIRVYAFPEFIDRCVRSLNDLLQNYIQALTNEEETKVIELRKGQNRVLFEMTMAKGAKVLSIQRALANLQKPSPNSASSSVASMSELSQTSSSINYSLKVVWPRRVCTGDAYVNFKNPEAFLCARRKVNSYITIGDFEALLQISNMQLNQLLLTYLPPKVTKEDISNYFNQLLSAQCLPSEFEVQLCRLGPFETSVKKLSEMKQQIEQNCKIYTNMRNIEVKVIKPEPSADYMTAYVNLFEKRCLNTEARNLSATKVNNMRLSCEPLYFSDLECSVQVYNALKFQINAELQIFSEKIKSKGDKYSLKAHIHKDTVAIKLSSHDLEIMTSLQVLINDLLNGVKLDKTNLRDIHKLFCHGGHIFLKTLEQTLKVFIMENYETKTIRLFGLKEDCNYIRQYICNFLEDTESEIVKNIILSDERQNRVLLKAVIAQYGANLEKFIEVCGLRSAALNIKTSCLSLYGRKENVEEAEKCIKELSATTGFSDVCSDESSEEMCPVCTCPVENLAFRLQHCGHLYCLGELRALITKGDFPIQCCASNCEKDIILEDIKYVLNNDPAEIDDLANKAFKAYLDKNKDKIFYCCAPDCSMFMYKKDIKQDKWNCPLCKNCICIKCNVVYHEGYTCDMYQGSRGDPDYSFKVWQKTTTQCKRCPKCKTAIEKKSGCNHMTCSSCQAHFCWLCVKEFPTGNAVYAHLGQEHRG